MKKIAIIISLFFLCSVVHASEITYSVETINGKNKLYIIDNKDRITYDEAVKKYDIDLYIQINYHDKKMYFYKGKEISKKEYTLGNSLEIATKKAKKYKEFGKVVKTTDEIINEIKGIKKSDTYGTFHLIFPSVSEIDFEKVYSFYREDYIKDKILFTYNEYGIRELNNSLPTKVDNELIIVNPNLKITKVEQEKVDIFLKEFIKYFDNKNDYEKIYGVYKNLEDNVNYENKNNKYLESVYDVLIQKRSNKKGKVTAFAYLMDNLGIKNYIVDDLNNLDNYPYNLVKVNNTWYVFDIKSGKLLGENKKYANDLNKTNIILSKDDYKLKNLNIEIDYKHLNEKIQSIKGLSIEKKDETFLTYLIFFLILTVIFLTIILLTKRKK